MLGALGQHYRSGQSLGGGHRKPGDESWPPPLAASVPGLPPELEVVPQFSGEWRPVGRRPAQLGRRRMYEPLGHRVRSRRSRAQVL